MTEDSRYWLRSSLAIIAYGLITLGGFTNSWPPIAAGLAFFAVWLVFMAMWLFPRGERRDD